jgi:hypothetical protein
MKNRGKRALSLDDACRKLTLSVDSPLSFFRSKLNLHGADDDLAYFFDARVDGCSHAAWKGVAPFKSSSMS